jgi:hypothetical protein
MRLQLAAHRAAAATAVPGEAGLTAGSGSWLPSTHLEQGHQLVYRLGWQLFKEEKAQQQAHQLLPPALVAGADRVRQRAQHLLDPHPLRAHQGQRVGCWEAARGAGALGWAGGAW